MKVSYRGFEIEAKREKCLAGYSLLYFSIFRESDGWELLSDYSEGDDTVHAAVGYLKETVDDYFKNPSEYEDEDECLND